MEILENKMSIIIYMAKLYSKIKEASQYFKAHEYEKALKLYTECIRESIKNQGEVEQTNNLLTSKAALQCNLGKYDEAMETINEVLVNNPYNYLGLIRRVNIYKKKQKFQKALEDLNIMQMYSPDSMQLNAMRLQIQHLRDKRSKERNSSSSQSQESDNNCQFTEEQELMFSNLKNIDRSSVSLNSSKKYSSRKSEVTISGDSIIQYESSQQACKLQNSKISKEDAQKKLLQTKKQIDQDDAKHGQEAPVAKVNVQMTKKKSILKNRDSKIYLSDEKPVDIRRRQSKLVDMLKDIDGKAISGSTGQQKQVQFRKSLFSNTAPLQSPVQKPQKLKTRKSCLKNASFNLGEFKAPRRSKLQSLSKMSIDGSIIRSKRKSIENNIIQESYGDDPQDSDEGSQYNIFGDKKCMLSDEIRDNLGIKKDEGQKSKFRATGSKSILKKNSIFGLKPKNSTEVTTQHIEAKKAKKSVMFTRSE